MNSVSYKELTKLYPEYPTFIQQSTVNQICLYISGHGCDKGKLFKDNQGLRELAQNNVIMLSETVHGATNFSINEKTNLEEVTRAFRDQRNSMIQSATMYRDELEQRKTRLLETPEYKDSEQNMYKDIPSEKDDFDSRLYDINYVRSLKEHTHCKFIQPVYDREYDFTDEDLDRTEDFGIYIVYSAQAGHENNVYYNYLERDDPHYLDEKHKEKFSNSLVNTKIQHYIEKAKTNLISHNIYFYQTLSKYLHDKKKVLLSDILELLLTKGLFERIIIIDTACRGICKSPLTRALTRHDMLLTENPIHVLHRRISSFGKKSRRKRMKKRQK